MKKNDANNCPDYNVLAEFVEGKMLQPEHEDIFLHIANCPSCRDLCSFAAKELAKRKAGKELRVSEKVQKEILKEISAITNRNNTWDAFRNYITHVFDSIEQAEVIAASETHCVIVFSSAPNGSDRNWKMRLQIPSQQEKNLKIELATSESSNAKGQLILCGNTVNVENGKGTIAYDVLRSSFSNPEIAFIFHDGERIAGYPEL